MSANDILASMGSYEEANIKSMKLAPALDTISITSVDERQVLKDLHEQLVDALPPLDVAPKMYSKDLITDKELEEFQAASTKSEKNTVLLDSMKRRQRGFLRTFINDVVSVIPGQGHISDALKTAWQKFADGNPKRRSTTTTPAQERTRPANSTPSSQVHTRVPQRRTGPFPCRAPPPQKSNDNRQDFFAMRDQIQSLKQELQESNDKLHAQEQYTDQLEKTVYQRDEEWKTDLEVNDEEWRAKLQKNDEHWRKKYEDLKVRNRRKIEELKRDYQAHLQAETSKQLNSFKRRLESLTRKQEASLNELGRQKEYVEKKITECSSVPQSRSWLYDESQSSDDDDETWSSEPPEYEVDHGHHYSSSYSLDQSDHEYAIDSRFPERKSPDHLTRAHKHHRSTDHLNRDRDSSVDKFETASLRHFSPTERPSTTNFTQSPQQPHHYRSFGRQSSSRRNYNDQGSHKHRGRASSGASNKSSLRNSISNSFKNLFGIGSKQTAESASSYQRHNSPRTGRGSGGGGGSGGSRHAAVITQQPQHSYVHYDSSVDSDAYASAREDFTDDEDFGFGPVGRTRQLEYERQPKEDREFTCHTPKVPAHMRPTSSTTSTTQYTQNKTRQAQKESGTKSEVPKPPANVRQTTTATPPSIQEKKSPTKTSSVASSSQANAHQQQNNPKLKREAASVVRKSKIQHQFTPQFNKDKTAQNTTTPSQPVDDGTSNEGTTKEHKEKSKSRSWNPFNKSSKK